MEAPGTSAGMPTVTKQSSVRDAPEGEFIYQSHLEVCENVDSRKVPGCGMGKRKRNLTYDTILV